jgi:hypothetical protein
VIYFIFVVLKILDRLSALCPVRIKKIKIKMMPLFQKVFHNTIVLDETEKLHHITFLIFNNNLL